MSNTLQALSRSLPRLETLQIEHTGTIVDPGEMRYLIGVFAPQLESSLQRLEILDGGIDAWPKYVNTMYFDDKTAVDKIQTSKLETLSIDWHTLFISPMDYSGRATCPLSSLRHLIFRYVEISGVQIPSTTLHLMLEHLRLRYPSLERLDLELRLQEPIDRKVLQHHCTAFESAGTIFNVLEHSRIANSPGSSRRTGSITTSKLEPLAIH